MSKIRRNGQLEEAMAALVQSQAVLVQNQTAFLARMAESDQRLSRLESVIAERFTRMETMMKEALEALPNRLGKTFGFAPPEGGADPTRANRT